MRLSYAENAVMAAVYRLASARGSVLVSKRQLMDEVSCKRSLKWLVRDHKQYGTKEEVERAEAAATVALGQTEPEPPAPAPARRRLFSGRTREQAPPVAVPPRPVALVDPEPYVDGLWVYAKPVTYAELEKTVRLLEMLEYFELTEASEQGEERYVITLTRKGQRWERDERDRKRQLAFKLAMSLITPILSFIFGILLRTLF